MADEFTADSKGRYFIDKDKDATLDYSFDWTTWLDGVADTISTASVTGVGVTVNTTAVVGKKVTAWVTGGTVGETATLTCEIRTANTPQRIDQRTVYLKIKER